MKLEEDGGVGGTEKREPDLEANVLFLAFDGRNPELDSSKMAD